MNTNMNVSQQGHILVVDDDDDIRAIIKTLLLSENFQVTDIGSSKDALLSLNSNIDLIILDVAMPDMSGFELCTKIRELSNVPILFLTAKSSNSDLLLGYAAGGDDYLIKPFSYSELLARVKGLLRRYTIYKGKNTPQLQTKYITHKNIRINCTHNQAWKDGIEFELTNTEYQILKLLMSYPNQIFSAQHIYESIWDSEYLPGSSNTIMVFIRKLRTKIEDNPKEPQLLVTVWGRGYKIV